MTAPADKPLPGDLEGGLRRLRLGAMRRLAPELLVTAKTQRWTPEDFLRTLVEAEIASTTFPIDLIHRPLIASCPERVCISCGLPWERERARQLAHLAVLGRLLPCCRCGADTQPGLVLDPFMGTGTVAVAAERRGRDWLGIELNPVFARLAETRIESGRESRAHNNQHAANRSPQPGDEEAMAA